jgi:hypothetical protein
MRTLVPGLCHVGAAGFIVSCAISDRLERCHAPLDSSDSLTPAAGALRSGRRHRVDHSQVPPANTRSGS